MATDIDNLLDQLDSTIATESPASGIMATVPSSEPATTEPVNIQINIAKQVERYNDISEEILTSWRSDRVEAQRAIGLVYEIISTTIASNKVPTSSLLEQYVNAIRAKSETSQVAVKLLDACAKLISATRQNINIHSNNHTNNLVITELERALSDPLRGDDV